MGAKTFQNVPHVFTRSFEHVFRKVKKNPPEDADDHRTDMDDDQDLVDNSDSDTLIRIVKFVKRGKAPGPDNIHNETPRLGTTTPLPHHQAMFFTPHTNKPHPNCVEISYPSYVTETRQTPPLHLAIGPSAL